MCKAYGVCLSTGEHTICLQTRSQRGPHGGWRRPCSVIVASNTCASARHIAHGCDPPDGKPHRTIIYSSPVLNNFPMDLRPSLFIWAHIAVRLFSTGFFPSSSARRAVVVGFSISCFLAVHIFMFHFRNRRTQATISIMAVLILNNRYLLTTKLRFTWFIWFYSSFTYFIGLKIAVNVVVFCFDLFLNICISCGRMTVNEHI